MKNVFVLLCAMTGLIISSCAPRQNVDQQFESLAGNYIERLLQLNPEWATGLGDHRFDARLNNYSVAGVEAQRTLAKAYLDSLTTLDVNKLTPTNKIDCRILRTNLEAMLYSLDTLKDYEWNPLSYNVGGAIYGLLAREFAPVKDRLTSVKERLSAISAVVAAAKTNLKNPPKIYTETAIRQNAGTISLIKEDLKMYLDQAPEMKTALAPVQAEAVKALEEYGQWLQKDLLPRSNGDFRLGDEKFRKKLYYSLESNLTKEDVLKTAEDDLKKTQETLYETALPLFKKFFPNVTDAKKLDDKKAIIKAVLDRLADTHPSNSTIVDLAKQDLKTTTDFVRTHDLVTVPDLSLIHISEPTR